MSPGKSGIYPRAVSAAAPSGGAERLRRRVYRSKAWAAARAAARARAGFRCERCGRPGRVEVHHRTPISAGGAPYDERNLEVLCRQCHFMAEPGRDAARDEWRRALNAGSQ